MLLERDGLLAILREKRDDAAAGKGTMLLVAGEAGAGKTVLLRTFVESLGPSTLVIQGACDPLTTPRPLSPLHDFAADPDSGLNDLPLGTPDNIGIFNAVLDRLKNTVRPVVMAIEDIHWADQATLDFIRFVGRRVADSKGLVICTYRDDEVGPDHPLRPVLGQLIPLPSTHRVTIPSLSLAAVGLLAKGTGVDPQRLHRATGGNAFFVTEVIAGGQDLPVTVQDAVVARLARLEPGPRDVVRAVSIAPRTLEVERALLLIGNDAESIDQAMSSGVILGDGKGLRFRHELARDAVERSIPPAKRFDLHRRMLTLLLEEDPPDHARLAHHAIQAESPDLIVEHAPVAGEAAVESGARKEAVAFYESALRHTDLIGAHRTADLRLSLLYQLRALDRQAAAVEQARLAAEHFSSANQPEKLANTLGQMSNALWSLNRMEESWEATDRALEVLRPLGPSEGLALAHYRAGHAHMLARHARPAVEHTVEARRVAEEVGSARVAWLADMMLGTIHIVVGEAGKGAELLKTANARAVQDQNLEFIDMALGMLGSGGGEARLYEDALEALEIGIAHGPLLTLAGKGRKRPANAKGEETCPDTWWSGSSRPVWRYRPRSRG